MRFATLLVLIASSSPCLAQVPAAKTALPDESDQKTALKVISEVYKPDYEKAKMPAQKIDLAKKLLGEGTATKDDLVSRYVLFRVARDIAAQQGDLATAFSAVGQISEEFETDRLQMQVDAAATAVKAPKPAKDHLACAALLEPFIDEAIAVDRYETAKSFAELTLSCAREGKDFDRIKQLLAKSKEIEESAAEFKNVAEAKVVLEAKPTDPDANFAVGKFLCMVKGDWRRGVTMLALSSNEHLKAAALMELEPKPDALKLGDAWLAIAETQDGIAKSRTFAHGSEWYRRALPSLSGLTKARVEKVLATSEQNGKAPSKSTQLRTKFAPDAVKINGRYYNVFFQKDIPWDAAKAACEKMGGQLACVETDELRERLAAMKGRGSPSRPENGRIIWVGGFQKRDGTFSWINGNPIDAFGNTVTAEEWRVLFTIGDNLGYRHNSGKAENVVIPYVQGFICEWEE